MSKRNRVAAITAVSLSLMAGTASNAQTPATERKPTFAFSMANKGPKQQANGPLFQKASASLEAAKVENGAGFATSLAKDADLKLLVQSKTGTGPERLSFTAETIRAALNSCIGPYSFDEGSTWVQLSWVCRVDADAPLAKVMTFRESPELTLTILYEKGLIKSILAMEPLPIPGGRLITMDAYTTMKGKQ